MRGHPGLFFVCWFVLNLAHHISKKVTNGRKGLVRGLGGRERSEKRWQWWRDGKSEGVGERGREG